MKKYSFKKLSGAGNDFILFDKNLNPELDLNAEFIQKICHRKYGIGADGVLIIEDSADFDFSMEYYNADGYLGSLCGNGARCALKYCFVSEKVKSNSAIFICDNVKYKGVQLPDGKVEFFLSEPTNLRTNFSINVFGQLIKSSYIDTGSPHVVINIQDILSDSENLDSHYKSIEDVPVNELGKEIRYYSEFENGTNR